MSIRASQMEGAALYALYFGGDDKLTTFYEVQSNNNYLQYNGRGRVAVRLDSGASAIGSSIMSVHVRGRKYGNPTGPITVGIRKASDDSLVTLGTFNVQHLPTDSEQTFAIRNRANTYDMVVNDLVSVEFPSSATDGFEIAVNTSVGNPTNYTGRSHNGTIWSNTTNPPAITIKGA